MTTTRRKVRARGTARADTSDVDPTEVSSALGLPLDPTYCSKRGDRFEVDGEVRVRDAGCCIMRTTPSVAVHADFEAHATWLLERVEPRISLLASWRERGWLVRLTVLTITDCIFSGPLVSAGMMRRLADLGVSIWWKTGFGADQFAREA